MDILAVQQRLIDSGFQFVEHVYNDGSEYNTSVRVSRDKSPHYFSNNILGDYGWGRFPRHDVWVMIAEWLDGQEFMDKEFGAST